MSMTMVRAHSMAWVWASMRPGNTVFPPRSSAKVRAEAYRSNASPLPKAGQDLPSRTAREVAIFR
jgi:hypothetical protein